MRVVNQVEMKEIEGELLNKEKFPSLLVIEAVAVKAAETIFDSYLHDGSFSKVVLLLGAGNNAADALAIGRHLERKGIDVLAWQLVATDKLSKELGEQIKLLTSTEITLFDNLEELSELLATDEERVLIIDGVLGLGFAAPLSEMLSDLFDEVNNSNHLVVSVDIPSGVCSTTGVAEENAIRATMTLAIEYPKMGHFFNQGPLHTGDLQVVTAVFPQKFLKEGRVNTFDLQIIEEIDHMSDFGHKYDQGHLLIIGGSKGMTGAPSLSASAATSAGIGIVTLHIDEDAVTELAASKPIDARIAIDFPDTKNISGVVVGPGWGKKDVTKKRSLIRKVAALKVPLVLDADALKVIDLEFLKESCKGREAVTLLTPHLGELSHLAQKELTDHEGWLFALQVAKEAEVNILLKNGPLLLLVTKRGETHLLFKPNSVLAKAGSGDVLAGLLAAYLARRASDDFVIVIEQVLARFVAAAYYTKEEVGEFSATVADLLIGIKSLKRSLHGEKHS